MKYTVTYLSRPGRKSPGDPFVSYDELGGRATSATDPKYLGERMSVEEEAIFSELEGDAFIIRDDCEYYNNSKY